MATSLPSQRIGTQPSSIGRYDIVTLLSEGGMARVFVALQRGAFAEKLVVLKQLRPEFAADSEFLAMFMDEARITLQLNHPNVVHTYEVVAEWPDYYLTMEFLEGQSLSQLLRRVGRPAFPVNLHIWILSQVLAGLQYAHDLRDLDGTPLGVVHRDVSPSNVLITSTGEVKVLDFGIAKAAGSMSSTQQGIMKGKIGWAAPEQCLGRSADSRADLFAVGVMLWEAIAGRRRVAVESSLAALQARVSDQEPQLESVVENVSPRLAQICRRALALDPAQRYASAHEFKRELDSYLAEVDPLSSDRSAELAEVMSEYFASEFARLRSAVESYVQEGRRTSTRRLIIADGSQRPQATPIVHDLTVAEPQTAGSRFSGALGGKKVLVAAALATVAGLALLTALFAPKRQTDVPVIAAKSALAPSALPAVLASAAPISPVASVRVAIAATPNRARIILDGKPLDNPFVGMLPRDDGAHELEVRAVGYRTERRALLLSSDVALSLELAPEWMRPREAVSGGRSRAQEPGQPLALQSAPAASPGQPVTRPATSSSVAQPGQDLKRGVRAPRAIDEKDPYQ